jgi:hypothetical protein
MQDEIATSHVGRPTLYTPELADTVLARLAAGETLKSICRFDGIPSEATVRGWALDDREGFAARFARAREIGAYSMADELLEISDDGRNDWVANNDPDNPGYALNGENVQRSKLRADSRKWLMSKVLPKVFGDRQQLEHTGVGGVPMVPILNVTISRE